MDRNTMDCKDIKALLSAIVDDELDAEHRHAAERHLADCAACRAIVNEAEGLNDLIAMDARAQIGSGELPERFEAQVLALTAFADGARRKRQRWGVWSGWIAAAASLALAAIIWVGDQPSFIPPADQFARQGTEAMERDFGATSGAPTVVARPASYTTGADLRSQTFDGGLPQEVFQLHRAALNDLTMPFEPLLLNRFSPAAGEGVVPDDVGMLRRDDAETLFSAALLIEMFAHSGQQAPAEIEHIRQVLAHDELLVRLSEVRQRIGEADRPTVFAAEAILLRLAHGPLDDEDAILLRETVNRMNLAGQLEAMSERPIRRGEQSS